MKILLTGFKPFLSEKINPSEILSTDLSDDFEEVTSLILPVEFGNSFKILKEHLHKNCYEFVIMLGQAAGRQKISLEKIALNWVQTEHRDELGMLPLSDFIVKNEPLALMSEFPVNEVYAELRKHDLPVEISFSAGTFVCNDLYYRTLSDFKGLNSVFIHLPFIKEQAGSSAVKPYLELNEQKNVLTRILKFILKK